MTITCPQCKYQNPDDAEFCENCGAQLPAPAPVGTAPNPASYPTGVSNGGPTGGSTGGSTFNSNPGPSGSLNQMVCPTCRAPLAPGDEFCFNCGTDVRNLTSGGSASNGGVDPMAATIVTAPQPPQQQGMKDEDIDKALADIDGPGGSDPAEAPTMVGPIQVQNSPVPSNSGPLAQPFSSQGQVVNPPAPASTNSGSIPVPPGPQGGVAGNAFGAPVPSTSTQPVPVIPRQTSGGSSGDLTLQVTGPYGDEKVEWKGTEILLGRNDAKTRVFPEVNLDDNAASRRHLSVWKDDADSLYYAQDLESANGTLLNGRDLKPGEPTLLNNGDVLKIGTRYSIKVQIS